jgi:hypothetical protein
MVLAGVQISYCLLLLLLLLQAALVGAVACLSSMIGYCVYSVLYPQLQQRRIDAARRKRFRMVAVQVRGAHGWHAASRHCCLWLDPSAFCFLVCILGALVGQQCT